LDIDKLASDIEKIVSKEYISTNLFERIKSSMDVFPYEAERENLPYLVVMPANKDEISRILIYANEHDIPVYIRGSGTSFTGASRYQEPGIVIMTRRLNHFQIYESLNYFECGPGLICNDVSKKLISKGFFLPFAPGSRLIASMGGLVSNNTSAHIIDASIGKPADYILGVEAVLPTGEIVETGTKGMRRIAGNDLTKIFAGGDGIFGVITNIRMRLVPAFSYAYGYAIYDDLDRLAKGVQRMYWEKRPIPLFMEFMEEKTANIGFELKGLGSPGGSVIFFVSIGRTKKEASEHLDLLFESFKEENPLTLRKIEDMDEWEKLWSAREVIGSFLMQKTGNQWSSAEIVSNLERLVECMEDAKNFNKGLPVLGKLDLYLFGHIGSLTMHPGVIIPKDWDNDMKREAIREKFQREEEINLKYGTCGGEWGQLAYRTSFFRRRYGEVGYNILKNLKKALDPKNILNRGVLEGV